MVFQSLVNGNSTIRIDNCLLCSAAASGQGIQKLARLTLQGLILHMQFHSSNRIIDDSLVIANLVSKLG
jgi:hypothetical protein